MDLLRPPKDPLTGGGLDHGSARPPSRPPKGGFLGPWISRDPESLYAGGVLQSDSRIRRWTGRDRAPYVSCCAATHIQVVDNGGTTEYPVNPLLH